MTRTLTALALSVLAASPALAGKSATSTTETSSTTASKTSDDFVFGQTVYTRAGKSFTADGFTVRPTVSMVTSTQWPYKLELVSSGAGDIAVDGAFLEGYGDATDLISTEGSELWVEKGTRLAGLGIAVSFDGGDGPDFDGGDGSDFKSVVSVADAKGTSSGLGIAIGAGSMDLWLEGAAAKQKACELVFFEDGVVVYDEEVACDAELSIRVANPKPVYADLHIPSHNPHPVITTNGDEMYIFE